MQTRSKKFAYLWEERYFSFHEKLDNGIQFKSYLLCDTEKFLDYQKDLIQDFIGEFMDACQWSRVEIQEVKDAFEVWLQNLNTKLKLFADKVRDVEYFPIKWFFQVIWDNILMASMIGDTTIMIFRDKKLYYQLHNSIDKRAKIDLFSDFIEGDLQKGDEVLYAWVRIGDIIDNSDIKEMETIMETQETPIIEFMQQILTSRVDKEYIGFLLYYVVSWGAPVIKANDEKQKWLNTRFINLKWKKTLLSNKYYVTVGIFGIIILFMFYQVIMQIFKAEPSDTFTTAAGEVIDITIDDIKKDIYAFQSMDPTSNEKWIKYNDILTKLTILETKGRWLEDVRKLKTIIENDYYKWFNIVHVKNINQFDDLATGIKTQIFTLNTTEKTKIGTLKWLYVDKEMMVAGTLWALVGTVNDGVRWSLVQYGIEEPLAGCSLSILKNGMYCYTSNGRIFLVSKWGVEPVTTTDEAGFPDTLGGVGVYGKANLYLFQSSSNNSLSGVFVSRYRNTVGSQSIFQGAQNYRVGAWAGSWVQLSSSGTFTNFAIDSTFLARRDGKLYQLRREPSLSVLDIREIKLMWWDQSTSKYSNDVKIIAYLWSQYVYLFDKVQQTFTVYDSRPLKTNDQYTSQYNLTYLFRFKFDLATNKVIDIAVPETTGNRPEAYILTERWVNKVNLYEFIDSIKDDNVLKTVTTE